MKFAILTFYRLKILLSRPLQIFLLLGMPFFVVALSWTLYDDYDLQGKIPIALVDLDESRYSQLVIQRMSSNPAIRAELCNTDEALKMVSIGRYEAAYIIRKGFMDNILKGRTEELVDMVKSPSSLSAEMLGELLSSEVIRLSSNVTAADYVVEEYARMGKINGTEYKDKLWEKAWQYTDSQWEPIPLMTSDYKELSYNGDYFADDGSSAGTFSKMFGIMASYIMFSMLISGSWIIEERRSGRINRLLSSCTPLTTYILSNLAATAILNGSMVLVMLCVLKLLIGLHSASFIIIFLASTAFILCTGSIGFLLSAFIRSISSVQILAPALTFASSLLGGCITDLSQINERFMSVAVFMPQHWLMKAAGQIALEQDIWSILPNILILLTAAGVFVMLGILLLTKARQKV
jgi:ABC-2 type transport system permease protein